MNHPKEMAEREQRVDDIWSVEEQQAEIQSLAEIRRQQIGRIEYRSAGATRKR